MDEIVKVGDRVEYDGSDGERVVATVVCVIAQRRLASVMLEGADTPLWVPMSILHVRDEAGHPTPGPAAVAAPLEEAPRETRQGCDCQNAQDPDAPSERPEHDLKAGLTEFPFPCEARYAGRAVRVLGMYRDTGRYLVRDYDVYSGEQVYRVVVQEELY